MGTYANGMVRWDHGVKQVLGSTDGLAGNQVRAVAEAADGSIWAGTSRGLSHVTGGKVHNFNVEDGLPREFITSLHAARDGRVWVGTANGAAVIEGEAIHAVDMRALDEAEDVFGFHEDADGTIWMASDRGLVRYRNGQLRLIGRRQGLPVDTIFQVVEDRDKHFWLTSNRGVLHLARADAEAVADGRAARVPVEVFGEADGMASAQCNGGSGPAAGVSHEGRVWVATAKGLSVVDPDRLAGFVRQQPPVVIEDVRLDDKSLPRQDSYVLPPGTRKLELHFAGLSYLMPQKIRYRYRLDGFDDDWVDRGTLRFAQYTNLDPGAYRFRVSAANPDGMFNPQEAALDFEIRPFLWQRPLFWAAVALLVLCALLAAYRWRIHQLRSDERRLRDLVDQRTLDLREQTLRLTAANDEKTVLLERLRLQAEASERQAREDALTGLANRRHFDERLADEFARACRDRQPLALALLDIDHFKRINDGWSHAVGDAALKTVAAVMRRETRGSDVVARYGGEEFALLFPRTTREEALLLMERLREAVTRCDFSDFAGDLRISVSIGVSDREGLAHHERMISRADQKLYEAKHAGRNRVCG
jgi:diguanylate cyclase (GGDEF)-like protein